MAAFIHLCSPAAPLHVALLASLVKHKMLTPSRITQGNVIVVGRKSPYSLYNQQLSSFEDDAGAYDQTDAAGFIKLQALRCAASDVSVHPPCQHGSWVAT